MNILKLRYLRGANLYFTEPCLLALIDLGERHEISSATMPGMTRRLLAMLPTLHKHARAEGRPGGFIERLHEGAHFADIVQHVTMELQQLAGGLATFSHLGEVRGHPGHYRVVCAYTSERVIAAALKLALKLVNHAADDMALDIDAELDRLRLMTQRCAVDADTALVLAAAQRRGIPCLRVTQEANLYQLGWGSRQQRLHATATLLDAGAPGLAGNTHLTRALLDRAGLPVPSGQCVTTLDQALRVLRRTRAAVTIKPPGATQGNGVTTGCKNEKDVTAAFAVARRYGSNVIVERHLSGHNYRVLVTGATVAAACLRRPPTVTGNGASTVAELIEAENARRSRGEDTGVLLASIPVDAIALAKLDQQGYRLDSIPPPGVEVVLRTNASLSTGGTSEDVTDLLPASTASSCIRAAAVIGLKVAGIDIICDDITLPLSVQGGGIIGINAAPGIRMHQYPSRGAPRQAGDAIINSMFGDGDGDGRIPVTAVTGTNGKTTTTRLIAHAAAGDDQVVGMSTTDGVYVGGVMIKAGDCTGYKSAQMVLAAPEVDFAVLETARGGILRHGLAFDRCDISVVLNVSADHLGLDGVDTLQDLARVKQVVASAATRALVLNADDPLCVAMAPQRRAGVELLYFSLDAENPVLLRHLDQGGRAAYLQDTMMVIADGACHQALLDIRRVPLTLGGLARHNVANALAAAAAQMAAGQRHDMIARALATFAPDARDNPLRCNVFDIDDIKVVVDFAHNGAAYAALAETARGMTSSRLVGVVSVPGDRRDEDLREIGRICAAGFDDLVIYESENRGRPQGDTAALLITGARTAGADAARMHCKIEVGHAIRFGLKLCRPGDVLVLGCSSSLDELTDAIGSPVYTATL